MILTLLTAVQSAHAAEQLPADLSFFEYLGTMVEDRGTWIDPMDIDPLTQLESTADSAQETKEVSKEVVEEVAKEVTGEVLQP